MLTVGDTQYKDNVASCWFEYDDKETVFYFESEHVCKETVAYAWLIMAFQIASVYGYNKIVFCPEIITSNGKAPDLKNLMEILACWREWYPEKNLSENIDFEFENIRQGKFDSQYKGLFFSSGVDSMDSLVAHEPDINTLVVIQGFDIKVENDSLFSDVVNHVNEVGRRYDKDVFAVKTNVFSQDDYLKSLMSPIAHGGAIASVAHALGLKSGIIASTFFEEDLFPWGSHPLTDEKYSSEFTSIIHGENIRRGEKLSRLCQHKFLLDHLRVCFTAPGNGILNCSDCHKCYRTMAALDILGEHPASFDWTDWKLEKLLKVYLNYTQNLHINDIRELALLHHRDDYVRIIDAAQKKTSNMVRISKFTRKVESWLFRALPFLKNNSKLSRLKARIFQSMFRTR